MWGPHPLYFTSGHLAQGCTGVGNSLALAQAASPRPSGSTALPPNTVRTPTPTAFHFALSMNVRSFPGHLGHPVMVFGVGGAEAALAVCTMAVRVPEHPPTAVTVCFSWFFC